MKKILITDVDNTLLDWQRLWYECFSAMSRKAIAISGIDSNVYYSECQYIHQKYGTSEYSFVLSELPSFNKLYGDDLLRVMQPAIDDYRKTRRKYLKLYDGVGLALDALRKDGIVTVAFTESKAFYTNYRFRKLGLDKKIDYLYSPPDHQLPNDPLAIRKYSPETYVLEHTQHRFTPEGENKPNPHILQSIINELGFELEDALYVGDNLLKDVFMAQEAKVLDVHASYGAAQHRAEEYDLLKKVTHWTPEMVAREQNAIRPNAIKPTLVLQHSFYEILDIVRTENGKT